MCKIWFYINEFVEFWDSFHSGFMNFFFFLNLQYTLLSVFLPQSEVFLSPCGHKLKV